jgi:hypothetical protein
MPVTYTHATTHARIDLIKIQFRRALRRTTSISPTTLESLMIGLHPDNKYIKELHIYGLNNQKLCRAQLIITIDWNEYETQLSHGKGTVAIDERWTDSTAIELDEAIILFDSFVRTNALTTEWRILYTAQVYANTSLLARVRQTLGLSSTSPVKWAGSPQGTKMSIPELSEITVGCFLV